MYYDKGGFQTQSKIMLKSIFYKNNLGNSLGSKIPQFLPQFIVNKTYPKMSQTQLLKVISTHQDIGHIEKLQKGRS